MSGFFRPSIHTVTGGLAVYCKKLCLAYYCRFIFNKTETYLSSAVSVGPVKFIYSEKAKLFLTFWTNVNFLNSKC